MWTPTERDLAHWGTTHLVQTHPMFCGWRLVSSKTSPVCCSNHVLIGRSDPKAPYTGNISIRKGVKGTPFGLLKVDFWFAEVGSIPIRLVKIWDSCKFSGNPHVFFPGMRSSQVLLAGLTTPSCHDSPHRFIVLVGDFPTSSKGKAPGGCSQK
jgi:hypothetical protein